MFQILFTAIYIAVSSLAFAQGLPSSNDNKTPQTLEEINADLERKKAQMEPFDEKKVKIDLESLGLDDVDQKAAEKLPEKKLEKKPETEEVKAPQAPIAKKPEEKKPEIQTPKIEEQPVENPVEKGSPVSKIQNFLKEVKPNKDDETEKDGQKKAQEKYINATKKSKSKKQLALEKRRLENEKKQEEKLKKLEVLRKKYLAEVNAKNADETFSAEDEDYEESGEKIIPHKKDINKFVSDEAPALPLLDRFRTKDNLHIPIILTYDEKIDALFGAVSSGNVASFNEAFRNVKNPNVKNKLGDTILTYSIMMQKYPIIASILSKGANPDFPNGLGYTPIDIAIALLDFKALDLLVTNKADVNYTDAFGRTYLMHASRIGFLAAVDLLVSKGTDINAMDDDGFTALSIAYRHQKEVIVAYLLKHGAKTWTEKPYHPENQSLIQELEGRWR